MRRLLACLCVCVLSVATASCGGGGGGGGGGAAPPAVTLSSEALRASHPAGESSPVLVKVALADLSVFNGDGVHVFVADPAGLLSSQATFAHVDGLTYGISLQTSGLQPPGRYQGQVEIRICRDQNCATQWPGSPYALPYDLTLTPGSLRLQPARPAVVESVDAAGAAAQPVPVLVKGQDSGWTATADAGWLKITPAQGPAWTSFSVAFDAAGLEPGPHEGQVTVRNAAGEVATQSFTFHVWPGNERRLLPSEWGVALTAVPGGDVLARTLTVRDSTGATLAWKARADVPWLTVTAAGSTGDGTVLTVSADPSLAPPDTLSIATVTVEAETAGVRPALVRVGLWRGATGLAATARLPRNAIGATQLIADRIRPHVYVHDGGTSIEIFHAYTAARIGTLTDVVASAGAMAVSPDGSLLYVLDVAGRAVAVIDLSTLRKVANWPVEGLLGADTSMLVVRPKGVDVVLVGNSTAYSLGRSLGATPISGVMAARVDGTQVYTKDSQSNPARSAAYEIDYPSSQPGRVLRVTTRASATWGAMGIDLAVAADGGIVYAVSHFDLRCATVDPADMMDFGSGLPGVDFRPTNVEVAADGRVICGITATADTQPDFWVHSPRGAILSSHKLAGPLRGLVPGQLVVTPDSRVVVALTTDPVIAFVPIGP